MAEKSSTNLEKALPGLIDKLKALHGSLNPDEKVVLQEILSSAASQAEHLSAHSEGAVDVRFSKSMSVHSSPEMRQAYVNLAKDLSED